MIIMAEKGERDKDLKSSYGKIIYNNFSKSDDKRIYGVVIYIGILFFVGIFFLSIPLISPNKVSNFDYLIIIPIGISLLLVSVMSIKYILFSFHEYILFDKGILTFGHWNEKNEFIQFKDTKEILFFPSKEMILERVVPLFDKYKKNIPDYSWRYWGADGMISIYKPKENSSSINAHFIEIKKFKDINKFKKKFIPLLEKYQINISGDITILGSGNHG
jgi:hypothetical protein